MYKLDLPVDMKETAAIERRRNAELQRQSRIFNARVRTIGVRINYEAIMILDYELIVLVEIYRNYMLICGTVGNFSWIFSL